MKKFATFTLVLALAAGTANAQYTEGASVSYDFDTDQSGSFVIATSGPDTASNFSYDYSSHVQITNQNAITPAPNTTGSTTLGLRLETNNVAPAEFNSILAYPDVSSLDLTDGFLLTFDFWNNHNGDAGGASGSTEFAFTGASVDNTIGDPTIAGSWGFGATGDGGAGQDYRYYQDGVRDIGATSSDQGTISGLNVDSGVEPFLTLFPNDGSAAGIPAATDIFAGVAGKQWVTVTLRVEAGVSRTLSYQSVASGAPVVVSTVTAPTGPDAAPYVGHVDLFTSFSDPAIDNFQVIDNITVTELIAPPPSASSNWNVYN